MGNASFIKESMSSTNGHGQRRAPTAEVIFGDVQSGGAEVARLANVAV